MDTIILEGDECYCERPGILGELREAHLRGPDSVTGNQSEAVTEMFANAHAFLNQLGWNTPVLGLDNQQTIAEFTRLLGDGWLSTGLLQMMVEELSTHTKIDAKIAANTIIAGPHFAQTLVSALDRDLPYARNTTQLLSCYEPNLKSLKKEKLYFPTHINENHWIAMHVDFVKHEYSYGEPSSVLSVLSEIL